MPIQNEFVTFTPYEQQMAELQRRQRMAELMQQQAMQPLETPQSGGRMIAKVSPLAGLAKMLQTYTTTKQLSDIDKQRGAIEESGRREALDFLDTLQRGKPMTTDQALEASLSAQPTQFTGQPLNQKDRMGQINQAMFSGNPNMRMAAQLAASQKPPSAMDYYGKIDPKDYTAESRRQFEATVAAGQPDVSVLQQVAPPENLPSSVQEYKFAQSQGYQGSYNDFVMEQRRAGATNVTTSYGTPVSGVDESGNPVFFQPTRDGGPPRIVQGVRPEARRLTEGEALSRGFANKMRASNDVISKSQYLPTVSSSMKESLPGSSLFMSPEQQNYEQAKRTFINSQLRDESGATISPAEFESADKQYFPQPGDGPEVIAQKAETRRIAIESMEVSGGARPARAQPSVSSDAVENLLKKYGVQ